MSWLPGDAYSSTVRSGRRPQPFSGREEACVSTPGSGLLRQSPAKKLVFPAGAAFQQAQDDALETIRSQGGRRS
jgi:hypothetical protein